MQKRLVVALAAGAAMMLPAGQPAGAEPGHIEQIRERLEDANQWRDHVMVVAHRGGGLQAGKTRFPENSIAAIEDAIAVGAEMVEVDVQRSSDGHFVVFHDSWLNRTSTCQGELVRRTLAELQTCHLIVEGTGQATAERIPTLEDILRVTRNRIFVNIDNKLEPRDLPSMVAVAARLGMADQVIVKQNLFNDAKIAEARRTMAVLDAGAKFMPIIADDAVRETGFLEAATAPLAPNAVELINWHTAGRSMTADGGPLFGARARAVAARGNWHLWVNTYAIVNMGAGMLSGGRGDALALSASLPGEAFGFWAEQGATIVQTDEPRFAIEWLTSNGYRRAYLPVAPAQTATEIVGQ